MIFLNEGDSTQVKGSAKDPYTVKKIGGIVSCTCMAWRNQNSSIDNRVCKHIKKEIDPACLLPQAQAVAGHLSQPTAAKAVSKTISDSSTATATVAVEPPLLLAHSWTDEDPTGWWMSEKLDGVRAYWDGEKFISRLGNEYHAPEWFKSGMPKGIKLDGELFAGRKKFQQTVSAVRKLIPDDKEWGDIKYMVFDALDRDESFEKRQKFILTLPATPVWSPLGQDVCRGVLHLKSQLAAVESMGGEGLMLRQSGSKYEAGRSHSLLKVKSFFDAEATIVGSKPGKGKHKGRMGAMTCQMASGVIFDVGSGFTDKQRENPPSVGTLITYRYQELTRDGVPRFPTFLRVYEGS